MKKKIIKRQTSVKRKDNWFLIVLFTVALLFLLLIFFQSIFPPKYYPAKTECKNMTVPKLLGQFHLNMKEINTSAKDVASEFIVSIGNVTQYEHFKDRNNTYINCQRDVCNVYVDEMAVKCETIGGTTG